MRTDQILSTFWKELGCSNQHVKRRQWNRHPNRLQRWNTHPNRLPRWNTHPNLLPRWNRYPNHLQRFTDCQRSEVRTSRWLRRKLGDVREDLLIDCPTHIAVYAAGLEVVQWDASRMGCEMRRGELQGEKRGTGTACARAEARRENMIKQLLWLSLSLSMRWALHAILAW